MEQTHTKLDHYAFVNDPLIKPNQPNYEKT